MPEFKVEMFSKKEEMETWLNSLLKDHYHVRIQNCVAIGDKVVVIAFRYIPSKDNPGTPANDVSQPETWHEPIIDTDK